MPVQITVDESCTGCGRCRQICPKGPRIWAIRTIDGKKDVYYAKDPTFCLFCTHCVGVCPVGAITVRNRFPAV
ncbi:MAG: 4Fe-4S binding protein [ANME-2 cluster archaeon]|nr:4Fe-4S binding protein [ANME-2 cluster archaeon]